jgi:hypothetical protein
MKMTLYLLLFLVVLVTYGTSDFLKGLPPYVQLGSIGAIMFGWIIFANLKLRKGEKEK